MLGSEREDPYSGRSGTGFTYVAVDEIDALYERARSKDADVLRDIHETDYGSRDFAVRDPEGNVWSFGTYRPSG